MGQKTAFFPPTRLLEHFIFKVGLVFDQRDWVGLLLNLFSLAFMRIGSFFKSILCVTVTQVSENTTKASIPPFTFRTASWKSSSFDRADPTNVGVWTKFMVDYERNCTHMSKITG